MPTDSSCTHAQNTGTTTVRRDRKIVFHASPLYIILLILVLSTSICSCSCRVFYFEAYKGAKADLDAISQDMCSVTAVNVTESECSIK